MILASSEWREWAASITDAEWRQIHDDLVQRGYAWPVEGGDILYYRELLISAMNVFARVPRSGGGR